MSVCPFCKAQVASSHGACPRCGKVASDHPSIAATGGRNLSTDFDDDLGGGGLELETGSSVGGGGHGVSTYGSDDGLSFDDDLMESGHSGPLELDMPVATPRSSGQHVVSAPPPSNPAPISSQQPPRISGSHPASSISGTQPAAAPISEPRPSGVPGSNPNPQFAPPAPPPSARPLPPTPAQMIAKYPPTPRGIHLAPVYFFKVFYRQLELRQDLESLRKGRSKDVPLYEAALQAHDKPTFTKGLAISAALFFVATLLFFTPVFLRFLRAP